jgi:glutamyl endopeptidase
MEPDEEITPSSYPGGDPYDVDDPPAFQIAASEPDLGVAPQAIDEMSEPVFMEDDADFAVYGDDVDPPPEPESNSNETGAMPETIFNDEFDWLRVRKTNTFPWSAICHLEITYQNGKGAFGTGWFVSNDTLLTAGHNVFSKDFRLPARRIRVIPGRNENLGPFRETYGTKFDALPGWVKTLKPEYDFGVIKVADPRVGAAAGSFRMGIISDQALARKPVINTAGYPYGNVTFGTQWFDHGHLKGFDAHFLKHRLDSLPGQSGSPIFVTKDGESRAIGVHVYGKNSHNLALRLTQNLVPAIRKWIG